MRKSIGLLLFCCVFEIPRWTASQETDDCLTARARKGKCIPISNCPALLALAFSPAISETDRRYLNAHRCGDRKVCCDASLQVTTTTTTPEPDEDSEEDEDEIQPVDLSYLPSGNDCGLDSAGQRIFGGDVTDKEQFRWTVALDYNLPKRKGVLCGGSLINTRYVLTAAHCVNSVKEDDLSLRLGEWDLEQNPDCEETDDQDCNPAVRIERVNRIIIHPDYRNKIHDIALLRMENALPDDYMSHILPICMPFTEELMQNSYINRNVSVVGWGQTENAIRSRLKMYAGLITISTRDCANALERQLSERQICAESSSDTVRDTCGGDSGGPLQIQINGSYYLVGIVSYGPPCGKTMLPAVYTRVTAYKEWILENIVD